MARAIWPNPIMPIVFPWSIRAVGCNGRARFRRKIASEPCRSYSAARTIRMVASARLSEFSRVWPFATITPSSVAAETSIPSMPVTGETTPRRRGADARTSARAAELGSRDQHIRVMRSAVHHRRPGNKAPDARDHRARVLCHPTGMLGLPSGPRSQSATAAFLRPQMRAPSAGRRDPTPAELFALTEPRRSERSEEVALAQLHAAMAQDVVRRGRMEEEVRQTEAQQVGAALE